MTMAAPDAPPHRRRARPGLVAMLAVAATLGAGLLGAGPGDTAEPIRVGVVKFGTVSWELDVVETHGLAAREGVDLKIVPLASTNATVTALQGGAVDLIVTDWIWVSRQRAQGRPYTFVPYSLAVGGLMVRADAGIRTLADLRGRKLGVAGGPTDKSWLLFRAYGRKTLGEDLAKVVEPSFAAAPLLNELVLRGELPAALNYWHYGARLAAAGLRELLSVSDVLRGLGVSTPVPLLGWAFDERWAETHRQPVEGFFRAAYAAKQRLLTSDAEWMRIRSLVGSGDEAVLRALRDAFRDGVPRRFGAAEIEAADTVLAILAQDGGEELVGGSRRLSPGTFWRGFRIDTPGS